MAYELTAICDACGRRVTFRVNALGKSFAVRPLPEGWTHVHRGGRPGVVTAEIGIACSRACLPNAREKLLARHARTPGPRRPRPKRVRPSSGRQ